MKDFLGNDHHLLKDLTEKDLRNSSTLRSTLIEYKEYYFFTAQKAPKSFEKKYESEEQRKIDDYQSMHQSAMNKDVERMNAHLQKNLDMIRDRAMGEEGIDYVHSIGNIDDPAVPNA